MSESVLPSTSNTISLEALKLPTVSKQGMKALDLLNSDDLDINKLNTVISADPMLVGILLKYANSPIYGLHFEIKNTLNAINLLGVEIVKSAILICTMRSVCKSENHASEMLWEKSINLSIMTRIIARKPFRKMANEIEVSAMMSQIGGLIISSNFPDEYASVVDSANEKLISVEEEENNFFGLHRSEVTAYALEKLRLPSIVINSLSAFFNGEQPTGIHSDTDKHVLTLFLATLLIDYNEEDNGVEKNESIIEIMEILELSDSDVDGFLEVYNEKLTEGFVF